VIVHSCWDYHLRLPEFLALVSALESRDIELQNSAQLVRWTSDMAGSEKLVVIRVNSGDHKHTALAEMKRERANPCEIEGKQSLFILNLPPRKMAGVVSEAILFDIGYMGGITPVPATPESAVPNGAGAG
jgi:tRNA-binding protein